jgi:hypothetical protein
MVAVGAARLRREVAERDLAQPGAAGGRVAAEVLLVVVMTAGVSVPMPILVVAEGVDARRGERDGDGAERHEQRQSTHG